MSGGEKKWVIKKNLLAEGSGKLRYVYQKKKNSLQYFYNTFTTSFEF